MRKRLEVCLGDLITAEGIARFFEVFTAEVWRRRAEIENAAGGPSALTQLSQLEEKIEQYQ